MEVKEVEGVRVRSGDTLVVVMPVNVPMAQIEKLKAHVERHSIGLIVLPAGAQVYVKENS